MSEIYLTERQLKRKRRIFKLKIYGAVILFLSSIIGSTYLIVYSRLFQIQDIKVVRVSEGSSEDSALGEGVVDKDLISDLESFYASRSEIAPLLGRDNILIWDSGSLPTSRAFWEKYASISELKIKKDYLKRSIEIDFRRRNKFGIWCLIRHTDASPGIATAEASSTLTQDTREERCSWFDKEGVIFSPAPRVEGNLIYRVDDFSDRELSFGDKVLDERLLSNLFKVFEFLDRTDFRIRTLKLENLALEEIVTDAPSSSTPKIYMSLRFDPSFALKPLESMRKSDLERAEYIDLRVENRLYYK